MSNRIGKKGHLYFDISGEWFTWFLRHLWVEGSETKAVGCWRAAFPKLSSVENIRGLFLDVVSGRKKFIGWGSKGLDLVDDGKKFWDARGDGVECEGFPLLDSWKDVLLLKKTKLFLRELELRIHRIITQEGSTNLMNEISNLWGGLRELAYILKLDDEILMLPAGFADMPVERIVHFQIEIVETYFEKKYGTKVLFIDWDRLTTTKTQAHNLQLRGWTGEDVDFDRSPILPPTVEKFIDDRIEASKRKGIRTEDIFKTQWTSGYVSPDGDFYGCPDLDHVSFAKDVVNGLQLRWKGEKDAQKVLDAFGWVVISMNRFRWHKRLTEAQRAAVGVYMTGKTMRMALFECFEYSKNITFEEFMEQEK